ncbi:MAG: alpha/beta fold hydrolase [Pseudomonadota bacterium]
MLKHSILSILFTSMLLLNSAVVSGEEKIGGPNSEAITIYSDGIRLAGNIWIPDNAAKGQKRPAVLMIHGWGGVKAHLNQAYAPQFASLGYVVLTFDYTGWGESEGVVVRTGPRPSSAQGAETHQTYASELREIRRIVNPLEQLDDIRAAFAYLATDPRVDSDRIAVWGTSLGGGLALATAIEFPQVRVLMSQVGAVNPQAGFVDLPDENPLSAKSMMVLRGMIARGQQPSFPDTATPGLQGYPDWADYVRYNPYQGLETLTAATLIIDAAKEELFDIQQNGADLYQRLKDQVPVRYETIPGAHYDVYRDSGYNQALAWQSAWLKQHLPPE